MRISCLSRYAFTGCVVAATLAGCGGSQAPIGAADAIPQTSTTTSHAQLTALMPGL